jgi:hypothetical protein
MRTTSQGVPQGTISGPPLFNQSTNSISVQHHDHTSRCKLTKFADDYTPVIGGNFHQPDSSFDILTNLEDQFQDRNLFLNRGKTYELLFNFSRKDDPPPISGIERAKSRKILLELSSTAS